MIDRDNDMSATEAGPLDDGPDRLMRPRRSRRQLKVTLRLKFGRWRMVRKGNVVSYERRWWGWPTL